MPAKIRPARAAGLSRPRLEEALGAGLWDRRLAIVVAPAGAGKTTLLTQFAASVGHPCAWFQAESSDGDAAGFLAYLEASLAKALPNLETGWTCVEDAAQALEHCGSARALLVIDDLHSLQGTPAEATLEQFLRYCPPSLAVLAATRTLPPLALLPALRLGGELLELSGEDLRFRTWEVERLFAELYRHPLPPEEAGELARRTEGWAAGLQMYHLSTTGKSPMERRQTLAALGVRSRLVREYLARNVLGDLPAELRRFLVGTCVLGRLSGPLCDQLLGSTGGAQTLRELERRQVFTYAVEDDGWYRYHEALRAHLEGLMLEELGAEATRRRYRQAAALLEAVGAPADALQAYCRGEDWESAGRLLGSDGELLAVGSGEWLRLLPPRIGAQDPWVLLATARRHRSCGRWQEAMEAYRAAEHNFGTQSGVETSAQERMALAAWLEPAAVCHDWSGLVRAAAGSSPVAAAGRAQQVAGAHGLLGSGIAFLLAGEIRQARPLLVAAAQAADASQELVAGALLASAIASALAGEQGAKTEAELASELSEHLGQPWLARMAQAVLALSDRADGRSEAAAVGLARRGAGDEWGSCLAGLLEGLGGLRSGGCHPRTLTEAAAGFAKLGAHSLEAWCLCVRALLLANDSDPLAQEVATAAERVARSAGVRGPLAYVYLAMARYETPRAPDFERWARTLADDCGLSLPTGPPDGGPVRVAAPSRTRVAVRCFGGFRLEVSGQTQDLGGVKPRARKLLHMLTMHAPRSVHREVLIDALWPGADPEVGPRNLHVALSSLRQLLSADPCSGSVRISREGEDYRLVAGDDAEIDVVTFARELALGRQHLAAGRVDPAIHALARALDLHAGDLLPEEGPDEWVLRDRENLRGAAVDAARTLADLLLTEGDPPSAARTCERGLAIDRHQDALWRILVRAHESAGNHAAAADARRRYERILTDLGVSP